MIYFFNYITATCANIPTFYHNGYHEPRKIIKNFFMNGIIIDCATVKYKHGRLLHKYYKYPEYFLHNIVMNALRLNCSLDQAN